jgi:hypothetical protein
MRYHPSTCVAKEPTLLRQTYIIHQKSIHPPWLPRHATHANIAPTCSALQRTFHFTTAPAHLSCTGVIQRRDKAPDRQRCERRGSTLRKVLRKQLVLACALGGERNERAKISSSQGHYALAHVRQQVVHSLLPDAELAAWLLLVVIALERFDTRGENNWPRQAVAVDERVQALIHPVHDQNVTKFQLRKRAGSYMRRQPADEASRCFAATSALIP